MFNSFYTSNNMFLVIIGNFNKDNAMEIIKKETISLRSNNNIEKIYDEEPDEVIEKEEEIEFNIEVPRIAVAYKFNKNLFKNIKVTPFELDLYFHFLISIALGPTSLKREEWFKNRLFLSSMYRIIEIDTHYVIEFSALTNYPDKLKEELVSYLKDLKIDKESFEREKKLWIASEIEGISNITSMKYNLMDDVLDYGKYIPNKIEIIRNLDYKILEKLKSVLVFKENATVKLVPKDKKK